MRSEGFSLAHPDCVFCRIVTGREPATVVAEWPDAVAIVPLNPVTPGHVLVIPRNHVADYREDPEVTALTARRAAEIAPHPSNLITSAGREATQSAFHLHVHIVPRAEGDGLALPWWSGPRWPDALLRVIHERDHAQARAVRLEQENAELLDLVRRFVQIFENDRDGSVAEALLNQIDNTREDQP